MIHSESSTLRPWQFFVLAALVAATAGVFLSRGTSPANVILISGVIGAAALAGTAVYRTLIPLVTPEAVESTEMIGGRTRAALEREKMLVLRSIKELDFDRAMNKISDQDYQEMVTRLRARAVRLIRQLDASQSGYRELIEQELARRLGRLAATDQVRLKPDTTDDQVRLKPDATDPEWIDAQGGSLPAPPKSCASCGTVNEADARFCKQCGVKLMAALALLAAIVFGPGFLLAQPDLRMMAGIPRPDGNLEDGVVTVRVVRQALANNVTGHPVELRVGDRVVTAKTDANGRATFRPGTPGTVLRASTVVDGERLESEEFPAPARGGVAVMLVAGLGAAPTQQPAQAGTVSFGSESRFIVDLADDTLQVYYLLEVVNPASYPVNPPQPLVLDLPSEASGATSLNTSSSQVAVRGDRVIVNPPLAPGTTPVQIGFTMPYSGGELTISQKLPLALAATNVVIRKIGEMGVASAQLHDQRETTIQGERYVIAAGPALVAASVLSFELRGLPHHSTLPRTITAILVGVIAFVGIWAAFSGRDRSGNAARRKQLESRREKAFAELVKLEEQRRAGKIDPARHQSRRAALISQLERIYGELDHQGPAAGGDEDVAA